MDNKQTENAVDCNARAPEEAPKKQVQGRWTSIIHKISKTYESWSEWYRKGTENTHTPPRGMF